MKQTAGNVFLDSNVLIYCYTITEPNKQQKAFQVIDINPQLFVSTQVLQEFCNVVHKKFSPQIVDLETALSEIESLVSIHDNTIDTVRKANGLKNKYGYSFYDSLIISAALECGCNTLYSEDMQHGQTIEDKLKIVNPFI
jgi:predicted nucleic acid-binding protein